MNLISNTKTVIFDDKVEEIKNLREALDKLLIQNIYIKFDDNISLEEKEEKDKLTNIRFVFADIIFGDSSSTDSKIAVESIVHSISENISINNGLFILVIWSSHNTEHQRELIRVLKDDLNYKFFPIKSINKADYIGNSPVKDVESLIETLKEELGSNLEYFNLLREWESEIQKSSAKVFDLFVDNEDEERTKDLLNGAMKSVVGTKQTADIEGKRKALWGSLNTILKDTIEKETKVSTHTDSILENLDLKISSLDNTHILNRKLLFETEMSEDSKKMYPGNIFSFDSYLSICEKLKEQICGYKEHKVLLSEIIIEEELITYMNTVCIGEGSTTKREKKVCREEKCNGFSPILMEFTPYCDYSQKGYKKSRLILGFLVPMEYRKFIRSSTKYLYLTSNFNLSEDRFKGDFFLVFNIKHIFGVNPELIKELDLLFRARKELVNDIQHNIAYHISRVGVTSL